MINIIEKHALKYDYDTERLKKSTQIILNFLGYGDFDIGILLTDNSKIQTMNKKFRGKDTPTDILSFPYHTKLKPDENIEITSEEDKSLGDIIISLEKSKVDAEEQNCSLSDYLNVLLVHGICHLLGYDHKIDSEYEKMEKQEKKLLELIA
ncbi:rRNA maturation RNase YbeY [bacterium]|mgnify:FL=1|jgi:probable rRNA maturation factor|nr:rRNA maturation RNase YbeY [bacterium]